MDTGICICICICILAYGGRMYVRVCAPSHLAHLDVGAGTGTPKQCGYASSVSGAGARRCKVYGDGNERIDD